jgi:hypothetical protein
MGDEAPAGAFPKVGSGRVEVETLRRTIAFSCVRQTAPHRTAPLAARAG